MHVGMCPICSCDLRSCPVKLLDISYVHTLIARLHDLEILLLPQTYEAEECERAMYLGQQFAVRRRTARLDLATVASHLGVSPDAVSRIERGDVLRHGATLHTYFAYADYLGLSLSDLFVSSPRQRTLYEAISAPACRVSDGKFPRRRENELLGSVLSAIHELEAIEEPVTQVAVAAKVKMTPEGLRYYPRVKHIFDEIAGRQRDKELLRLRHKARENKMLQQVHAAIAEMEAQGRIVTQMGISEIVGISPTGLKKYPSIKEVLNRLTKARPAKREQAQ